MDIKKLKIIDKEYLENTIVNLDKEFLSKKYTLKASTQSIEDKIKKIVGEENFDQLNNDNIDDIIGLRINDINKISKYFIPMDELPNPNVADEEGLYIILDENSIDETCKFFVCTVVKQNNVKKWAIISSPSPILETEDINFREEFQNCKNKEDNKGKLGFASFEILKNYIIDKHIQANGLTEDNGSINGYICDFFYKNNNKIKEITIIITLEGYLYYKFKGETFYKKINDVNTFANCVIDPTSQPEPEPEENSDNEGDDR